MQAELVKPPVANTSIGQASMHDSVGFAEWVQEARKAALTAKSEADRAELIRSSVEQMQRLHQPAQEDAVGRAEAAALEARQVAVATREDCNTYVQNARKLAGEAQAAYERLAQQPPPPPPGPTPSGLDDFQQTAQQWLKECEASASVARQHAENASEFAKRANVSAGQAAKRAESIKDAAHRAIGESPGGAGPPQPFVTELKFEIEQLQSQFRDLNQEIGQKVNDRTERRYDPLEGLPEPPGWWKSGPYGPLPGAFGVYTETFAGSRLPPIFKTVTSFLERHIAQLHSWKRIPYRNGLKFSPQVFP